MATERPSLVDKVGAQLLRVKGVRWSAQRVPTIVNLGFLDRSGYFSLKQLDNYTEEAERTPFN
jgi:hypothetical protein